MSEKLCTLRKIGGGKLKESLLWTNANPSSAFGDVTLDLGEDLSKYDFIKVDYKRTTADSAVYSLYMPNESIATTDIEIAFNSGVINGRIIYTRGFCVLPSRTQMWFRNSMGLNVASTDNNTCIPLHIYGVK